MAPHSMAPHSRAPHSRGGCGPQKHGPSILTAAVDEVRHQAVEKGSGDTQTCLVLIFVK